MHVPPHIKRGWSFEKRRQMRIVELQVGVRKEFQEVLLGNGGGWREAELIFHLPRQKEMSGRTPSRLLKYGPEYFPP
jgi:hypothetical protein